MKLKKLRTLLLLSFVTTLVSAGVAYPAAGYAATATPPLAFYTSTYNATNYTTSDAVKILDTATNAVSQLTINNTAKSRHYPSYSPDHSTLVWGVTTSGQSAGEVGFYNTATKSTKFVTLPTNENFGNVTTGFAWSPDSKQIAFVSWDATGAQNDEHYYLHIMNADGTGLTTVDNIPANTTPYPQITSLALTGDGRVAFTAGYDTGNGVYIVTPGQQATTLPQSTDQGVCANVQLVPHTTSTLVYSCSNYTDTTATNVVLKDSGAASPTVLYKQTAADTAVGDTYNVVNSIAASPDGTRLAMRLNTVQVTGQCTVQSTLKVWTTGITTVTAPRAVFKASPISGSSCMGGADFSYNLVWSPDQSSVAFLGNTADSTGGAAINLTTLAGTPATKQLTAAGIHVHDLSW